MKNKIRSLFKKLRNRFKKLILIIDNVRAEYYNEPKLNSINLSVIADIVNTIKSEAMKNVEFGVYDYSCKKNHICSTRKKIIEERSALSFIKVNCNTDRRRTMKVVKAKHVFYTMCEDENVWEFSLTTYCKAFTFNDNEDAVLIHVCNMLAYGILANSDIFDNSIYEVKVPDIRKIDIIGEKKYDGYIETYGDKDIFKEVDINNTDIDNEYDIEVVKNRNPMVVDVYRKKTKRF